MPPKLLSHPLLLRWIKQFAKVVKEKLLTVVDNLEDHTLPDIIEMDEIYTCIKKGNQEFHYGLLIVGGVVKLLLIK